MVRIYSHCDKDCWINLISQSPCHSFESSLHAYRRFSQPNFLLVLASRIRLRLIQLTSISVSSIKCWFDARVKAAAASSEEDGKVAE